MRTSTLDGWIRPSSNGSIPIRPRRAGGGSCGRRGPSGAIYKLQRKAWFGLARSAPCRTALPGPALARDPRAQGAGRRRAALDHMPVVVAEAHGATVTDVDGNMFIDFTGGVGCLNVGHARAARRRGRAASSSRASRTRTSRSSRTRATSSWRSASSSWCPISGRGRAAFFNSGAEAIENAVKIARVVHTGRPGGDRLRRRLPRPDADGDEL